MLKQEFDRLVGCSNGSRKLVDILRLNNSLQIVFKQLGEIVYRNDEFLPIQYGYQRNPDQLTLQFGASEILDDIFPVGRVVILAQIRLQLPAKDLQGSRFAYTVRTNPANRISGALGQAAVCR